MNYCKKCLYPTTKLDLIFNKEGVCSACQSYENRQQIDWDDRKKKFLEICNRYKRDNNYDCLVPVSGGKDRDIAKGTITNLTSLPSKIPTQTFFCRGDITIWWQKRAFLTTNHIFPRTQMSVCPCVSCIKSVKPTPCSKMKYRNL